MKTIKKAAIFSLAVFAGAIIFSPFVFAGKSHPPMKKAESPQRVKSAKQIQLAGQNNQPALNHGQSGPKIGGANNFPGRGSHYMGWQGGPNLNPVGKGSDTGPKTGGNQTSPTGPAWTQQKNNQAVKGSVSDLSREARMKKLFDPTGGFNDKSGGKPVDFSNKLTGRAYGKDALTGASGQIDLTPQTVHPGDGKNRSSKRSQQSESDNDDIFDGDGNFMGKRGELKKNNYEDTWGGMTQAEKDAYVKDNEEAKNGYLGGPAAQQEMKERQEKEWRGSETKEQREQMKEQQEKEMDTAQGTTEPRERNDNEGDFPTTPSGGDTTVATPNPDSVDTSHLPTWLQHVDDGKRISPKQAEQERKRQVTMPNENNREMNPANIQVTGQDITRRLTSGKIDPADNDGTTAGSPGSQTGNIRTGQPRPGGGDEGRTGDQGTTDKR